MQGVPSTSSDNRTRGHAHVVNTPVVYETLKGGSVKRLGAYLSPISPFLSSLITGSPNLHYILVYNYKLYFPLLITTEISN